MGIAGARQAFGIEAHDIRAELDEHFRQPGDQAGAVRAGDLDAVGDMGLFGVHRLIAEGGDRNLGPGQFLHATELLFDARQWDVVGQFADRIEFGGTPQHGECGVPQIGADIEEATGDGGDKAGVILTEDGDEGDVRHA